MIGSVSASSTGTRAVTPDTAAAAPLREPWWPRWRVPILAWALSRAMVIGVAVLVEVWLGPTSLGNDRSVPGPLTLLGSWDTSWYIDIARHGYDHNTGLVGVVMTNLAFFPLLPAIMWLGLKTATNPFIWGFVVSNLAFFGAVVGLHRLSWDRRGLAFANRATWVFALAPPAIYASLAYTDGILVGLAVGAALAATRGRWYLAALAAALASLTRPQGILIAALVVLIALLETDATLKTRIRHALIGVGSRGPDARRIPRVDAGRARLLAVAAQRSKRMAPRAAGGELHHESPAGDMACHQLRDPAVPARPVPSPGVDR